MHTKNFNKKYFNIVDVNIVNIIDSIFKFNNINNTENGELYNPVSGSKIIQKLNHLDEIELKNTLFMGFQHLYWFLRSNFHKSKNFLNPDDTAPGWVFQMSSKWLTLLVDVYDIKAFSEDITVQLQMSESSDFRNIVTVCTLSVLSNYVINNNLATLEEINKYGGWYNPDIWLQFSKTM